MQSLAKVVTYRVFCGSKACGKRMPTGCLKIKSWHNVQPLFLFFSFCFFLLFDSSTGAYNLFWSNWPPIPSLQFLPYFPPLSLPISMCFDAKVTESTQCCLYRCGGRISTGAWVSSLGSHPWESDSCSVSSHQLPVAPQTGVGLLLPCWSLADLILERSLVCSQSCCDIAVMPWNYCLTTDAHCLWLLQFSYTLFHDDPWALRGGSVV